MVDAALHPADEFAYVRSQIGEHVMAQAVLARREEALSAAIVADREARVGALHHAVVSRVRGRDVVDAMRLPDLGRVLDALCGWCLVVDCETTGLDPETDRIVSLAMRPVRVFTSVRIAGPGPDAERRVETAGTWCGTFNPGRPSSPEALAVHGMSEESLRGHHPFAEYAREIDDVIHGEDEHWPEPGEAPTLIAHNAPFDLAFLANEFERAGRPRPDPAAVIDTRVVSKMLWPGEKGSLDALADRLGVDRVRYRDGRPAAKDDVDLVAACLPGLADEIARRLGR